MERVTVTSDTTPTWSVELPFADGSLYRDDADGCLVATESAVAAVRADGQVRWSADVPFYRSREPIARDGKIFRIEDGCIVTRDLATGQATGSIEIGPDGNSLDFDAWGGFVFRQVARSGEPRLRSVTALGEPRWTVPMTQGMDAFDLRVFGDLVVADFDERLRAYDLDGRARWVAWPYAGITDPDPAAIPRAVEHDQVKGLWAYDERALLARFDWSDGGGYYLVDTLGRSHPFVTTRQVGPPLAVVTGLTGGPRLAIQGPRSQVGLDYTYRVWMVEGEGAVWEHVMDVAPTGLREGAGGTLIVTSTPTQRRWETYHWLSPLWHETFVRCLEPDGATRWTWYAPGMISQHPVVRPDGVVYVGAAGRLYALPA